jgi:hypothetical protein
LHGAPHEKLAAENEENETSDEGKCNLNHSPLSLSFRGAAALVSLLASCCIPVSGRRAFLRVKRVRPCNWSWFICEPVSGHLLLAAIQF